MIMEEKKDDDFSNEEKETKILKTRWRVSIKMYDSRQQESHLLTFKDIEDSIDTFDGENDKTIDR